LGYLHLEKVASGKIHIRAVLVFLGIFGGFWLEWIFMKKGDCWPGYAQRWHRKSWRLEDGRIYRRGRRGRGENEGLRMRDEG
jgi:hypothetical protein